MTATWVCPPGAYSATPEKIAHLEQELDANVATNIPENLGAIVLASPARTGHYGAIGRSLEIAKGFDEMAQTLPTFEAASKFVYIFDKDAERYVAHSTRLIQPHDNRQLAAVEEIMNDLEGQVDLGDALAYHDVNDLTRCIFISTDLASPGVLPTRSKPYGLLAYKTIFGIADQEETSHIFAYMNRYTLRALGRLGVVPEALCGKNDYRIPPMGDLTFEAYQPYVIPLSGHNNRVFNDPEYAARYSHWASVIAGIDVPVLHMQDTIDGKTR